MKLICEVHENLRVITEDSAEDGKKNFFIEGVFMQGNVKNKNGRLYPMDILIREAERYEKDYIRENRAYGELGHPQGPTINLERVSHMIKSLKRDGDNYVGRAKILDTPYGSIVQNLMREGARLGVSSRGMGTLTKTNGVDQVQDDYHLATAADIVADPSAPHAFVRGIMEGKDWVYNNGMFKEVDLEIAKETIEKGVRQNMSEQAMLRVFTKFISRL